MTATTADVFVHEECQKHAYMFPKWLDRTHGALDFYRDNLSDEDLDAFEDNPLAFVWKTKPERCYHLAQEYVREQMNFPFWPGQVYWCPCWASSTTKFYYKVVKVCPKTVTVQAVHETNVPGVWQVNDLRPYRCRKVEHELHNDSRRIFLAPWRTVQS